MHPQLRGALPLSFQGAFSSVSSVSGHHLSDLPSRPSVCLSARPPPLPCPFCEVRKRTNKRNHTAAAEDKYIIHTSCIHHTCAHPYLRTSIHPYIPTHTHTPGLQLAPQSICSVSPKVGGREFCVTNGEGEGGRGVLGEGVPFISVRQTLRTAFSPTLYVRRVNRRVNRNVWNPLQAGKGEGN